MPDDSNLKYTQSTYHVKTNVATSSKKPLRESPRREPPKREPPKREPPKKEPIKVEPPKREPPKREPIKAVTPKKEIITKTVKKEIGGGAGKCIISNDIKNLHLKIIKKGAKPIAGLTEEKDAQPKGLGPKRATRILKQFGLTGVYNEKKDKEARKNLRFMITKFAPKREVKTKNGKEYVKRAKVQRLITPDRLRRKRLLKKFHLDKREKAVKDKKAYEDLMKKTFAKEKKEAKEAKQSKKEAKGKK